MPSYGNIQAKAVIFSLLSFLMGETKCVLRSVIRESAYVHNPAFQVLYQFTKFHETGLYIIPLEITECPTFLFHIFGNNMMVDK
jgi:hypothetical protein